MNLAMWRVARTSASAHWQKANRPTGSLAYSLLFQNRLSYDNLSALTASGQSNNGFSHFSASLLRFEPLTDPQRRENHATAEWSVSARVPISIELITAWFISKHRYGYKISVLLRFLFYLIEICNHNLFTSYLNWINMFVFLALKLDEWTYKC